MENTTVNRYVNEDTLVGEIVRSYPESIDILLGIGMHCLGCPASQAESLKDACAVHVVEALNNTIAANRK